MYKSYSYNNMPRPITNTQQQNRKTELPSEPKPAAAEPAEVKTKSEPEKALLQSDDMILLIVIALLLINDCDDKLLLLALAYVFFSDYFM